MTEIVMFQSTPPSREATPLAHPMSRPHDVSIHAPLTGGDLDPLPGRVSQGFQSTPPSREATAISCG